MSLDFTAVTGAIDTTTIILAITAVAAIKILPGVARWGYYKVIDWFGNYKEEKRIQKEISYNLKHEPGYREIK